MNRSGDAELAIAWADGYIAGIRSIAAFAKDPNAPIPANPYAKQMAFPFQ